MLAIVLKGLVTGRLDHKGKHFTFDNVPLELGPVQKPHPPLWHATRSLENAPRLAGEGCNVALSLPTREAAAFCGAYRAAWVALERSPLDMPFLGNTRNIAGRRQRSRDRSPLPSAPSRSGTIRWSTSGASTT